MSRNLVLSLVFLFTLTAAHAQQSAHLLPVASIDEARAPSSTQETAVLAGGCFWGVQDVFQHVKGVVNAVSGYAGGGEATADYNIVSRGQSGHAESVRITYDASQITYGQLLQIYMSVAHDPTQRNAQGPDIGTQYRSAIFPQNATQARIAKAYIAQVNASHRFSAPLATSLESGRTFYPAEAYHQDYATLHPDQPYIAYNDLPKVAALKQLFPTLYREEPVLVAKMGLAK